MKYITLFETAAAYNAATLDLPNVSLIEETMSVGYNPYVPETRVVCKYNVTDTSSPTALRTSYEHNVFKSMEIDGVMLDELVTDYTFDTTGVHTVKYELYDETKLGNSAPVFNNGNLIECIIPDSVTSIGSYALYQCTSLISITIPNSVTSINNSAFESCYNLTSINIPNGVTNISDQTFYNCGLTSIDIPDNVTSIGNKAFYACNRLTSITIPSSVTYIGGSAFGSTNVLKVLNYNAKYELSASFKGDWQNLETVIIGDSTPFIGDSALSGCTSLTSVTIGKGVTDIGDSVFAECNSLTSIVIPDSVTSIGSYAFYNCTDLTSVTIGNGVTDIDYNAFDGCNSLISVIIGNGVTSIGNNTFKSCSSLTNITIPSNVTSIGNSAFEYCSNLTNITSNAITAPTIQNYTFHGVKTSGTLTVPSGSTGYNAWMSTDDYYLGKYEWTKVEQ